MEPLWGSGGSIDNRHSADNHWRGGHNDRNSADDDWRIVNIAGDGSGLTGQTGIAFAATPDADGPLRLSAVIGSFGAFACSQFVSGDGAATNITIGNFTSTTRAVRLDVFSANGNLVRTVSTTSIPPRGFVVFSSEFGTFPPQE